MSSQTPNLSESDMKLLLNALTNSSLGNGKKKGMSLEYKNALLQKLSATKNDESISQKPMSEMTEQEKKEHREALRQKLHAKTSTMKTSRGSKVIKNKLYEDSLSKLNLGGNVAPEPPSLNQEKEQQPHEQEQQPQAQEQLDEFVID
jgi:hypothetical protein